MPRGGARTGAGRRRGSANKATADVKAAASVYSEDAVATLAKIMKSDDHPAAARVAAANALLDRAHGKPKQAVEHEGALTGALTVTYVTQKSGAQPSSSPEDYETEA